MGYKLGTNCVNGKECTPVSFLLLLLTFENIYSATDMISIQHSLMFIIKALIESVTAFYWSYLKFNFKNQVQQTTSITFHA